MIYNHLRIEGLCCKIFLPWSFLYCCFDPILYGSISKDRNIKAYASSQGNFFFILLLVSVILHKERVNFSENLFGHNLYITLMEFGNGQIGLCLSSLYFVLYLIIRRSHSHQSFWSNSYYQVLDTTSVSLESLQC